MKRILMLPLFFLLIANATQAYASPHTEYPPIDCENDSKLELYLQLVAKDVYGQTLDCDTSFPMDDKAWYLGDAVSGLCSFDMFSVNELWEVDREYRYSFAKPTTIRILMAKLQGLELDDVRCDLNRSID